MLQTNSLIIYGCKFTSNAQNEVGILTPLLHCSFIEPSNTEFSRGLPNSQKLRIFIDRKLLLLQIL